MNERNELESLENPSLNLHLLCIQLFTQSFMSLRAACRVVELLEQQKLYEGKVPHHSSVSNWVCRAGLGLLKKACGDMRPYVAIIDTSICYHKQKLLTILKVPLSHHAEGRLAPVLEDIHCVGLEIQETFDGESVCEALEKCLGIKNPPKAFLKDGGTDLRCGVRKYRKKVEGYVGIISDISHVAANALKAYYQKQPKMVSFLSRIESLRKQLFQSPLSFKRCPQVRTKGRFQGISRLTRWAKEALSFLNGQREHAQDSMSENIQRTVKKLEKLEPWIDSFHAHNETICEFMKTLKNQGLSTQNFPSLKALLKESCLPKPIKTKLLQWLYRHDHERFRITGCDSLPLLCSSDIIESSMGKIKAVLERNPTLEFGKLTLSLPLFCGKHSHQDIITALQSVSQKELNEYLKENYSHTIRKKQREFEALTKGGTVPEMVEYQAS